MVTCRQMSKRALTSLVQEGEPVQDSMGLCSVGSPGYRTWEVRLETGKTTKWHSTVLHMAPDFLICKLLLGQNYLFPWRADRIITLFSCCKSRNEFLLISGQVGDCPLGRDGSSHLRGSELCSPRGAAWIPAALLCPFQSRPCHSFHLDPGAAGGQPGNGAQAGQTRCKGLVKPGQSCLSPELPAFPTLPASFPEYLLPAVTKETELPVGSSSLQCAHRRARELGYHPGLGQPQP